MNFRFLLSMVLVGACGCSSSSSSGPSTTDSGAISADSSSHDATAGEGGDADPLDSAMNEASDGCVPMTCEKLGATCGEIPNGCGGKLVCGTCQLPQTCGGSAMPHVCGCKPKTCIDLGATCGKLPDGCTGEVDCGTCPSGQSCGAKGANQCGPGSCLPKSCLQLGRACGAANDGCGNPLNCGICPQAGMVCTADGQCCKGKTCVELGFECGLHDDGCGQKVYCGKCDSPNECGASEVGKCGCVSDWDMLCSPEGDYCGEVTDSCGIVRKCPSKCPPGKVCNLCGDWRCADKYNECQKRSDPRR